MKVRSRYSLSITFLFLVVASAFGQQEESKNINESWMGIKTLQVEHRYGDLIILPSESGEVILEASIRVWADDKKDARIMVEKFDVKRNKYGSKLSLSTDLNARNWVTSGNKTKIKFDDGTKISGIREYDISFKLYIPELDEVELSNKYSDIEIETNISGRLLIKQYDASVTMQDASGPVTLLLKYGDFEAENIGRAELDLYDSEIEIESTEELRLTSKYSEVRIGNTSSAQIHSYDDEIEIGDIAGELKLNAKYTELSIASSSDAELQLYDSDLTFGEAGKMNILTKYCDVELRNARDLGVQQSYDDNYSVGNLGSLRVGNSKYTEYEFDEIADRVEIQSSYDDEFVIRNIGNAFDRLEIDCKYTDLRIPLDEISGYHLLTYSKYGEIKYPEPGQRFILKESNDVVEIDGVIGENSNDAQVKIKAYDSNIHLH